MILTGGRLRSENCSKEVWQLKLESKETENETTPKWIKLPEMIDAREAHSSLSFEHQVFVVCGNDGRKNLPTVEVLDMAPRQGPWLRKCQAGWSMIGDYCVRPRQLPIVS